MKKINFVLTIAVIALLALTTFVTTSIPKSTVLAADTEWQLNITGLVNNPLNLTLVNIEGMPQTTVQATLYCVDFPTYVVASGAWTGVDLAYLLEQAQVSPSAIKVAFYAIDGYSTDLDIGTATSGNVLLAYEKDGIPLDETLRLVVPGKWGYKWISMVNGITPVNYDFKGKWESQGYSDDADIASGAGLQPSITTTGPPSSTDQPNEPSADQPNEQPVTPSSPEPSNSSAVVPSEKTTNSNSPPESENLEPFPFVWIAFAIVMALAIMGLTIYVKKRH